MLKNPKSKTAFKTQTSLLGQRNEKKPENAVKRSVVVKYHSILMD